MEPPPLPPQALPSLTRLSLRIHDDDPLPLALGLLRKLLAAAPRVARVTLELFDMEWAGPAPPVPLALLDELQAAGVQKLALLLNAEGEGSVEAVAPLVAATAARGGWLKVTVRFDSRMGPVVLASPRDLAFFLAHPEYYPA